MLTLVYKQRYIKDRKHKALKSPLGKTVAILVSLLLISTTSVEASPTENVRNLFLPGYCGFSKTQNENTAKTLESANDKMVSIGREIAKPYLVPAASINPSADYVKSLPAVPAAILMVITGFFCVSFVRDQKLWLAALSALLWAGQGGINVVPQLAKHLRPQTCTNQHSAAKAVNYYSLENTCKARFDIEGTKHSGLVNYPPGVPNGKNAFRRFLRSNRFNIPAQTGLRVRTHQFAAINKPWLCLISTSICSSPRTEQTIYLKPLLIQTLSRGPPNSA